MKTAKLFVALLVIVTVGHSCDLLDDKKDTPCGTEIDIKNHNPDTYDILLDTIGGILTYSLRSDSAYMYYTWYDENLCGDSEPRLTWRASVKDSLSNTGRVYFQADWYILFQYKMRAINPITTHVGSYNIYTYESEYTVGLAQMYSGEEGLMYSTMYFAFKSFGSKARDFAYFKRQLVTATISIEYYPYQ
ncbi:MAG: hypothetical protein WCR72_15770 [Bacteroidota bacterium]